MIRISREGDLNFMLRPAAGGDAEFEEVALRLAEGGALDEWAQAWRWSRDDAELAENYRQAVAAVEEVLGREVEVVVENVGLAACAPWWRACRLRRP